MKWSDPSELDELYLAGHFARMPSDHLRQLHWMYQACLADYRELALQASKTTNQDLRANTQTLMFLLVPKLLETQRAYLEELSLWKAEARLKAYIAHADLPPLDLACWSTDLVLKVIAAGGDAEGGEKT